MNTILKVECNGDVRRTVIEGRTSYAAVERAVQEVFPGHGADVAKYLDEDGDSCTLKQQTFADFLATAQETKQGTVLRLRLSPTLEETSGASNLGGETATETDIFPISTPTNSPRGLSTAGQHLILSDTTEHNHEEKIGMVLAAFDESGDGHLDFAEMGVLHESAYGAELSQEVYAMMCLDEGEDPEIGLDREALMCIYNRCRNLEVDFDAAKVVLEGSSFNKRPKQQQPVAQPLSKAMASISATDEISLDTTVYPMSTPPTSPRGGCGEAACNPHAVDGNCPAQEQCSEAVVGDVAVYDFVAEHDHEEQIDIVLAAFDKNQDGHLNFAELSELHNAAWRGVLSHELYAKMCVIEGEDPDVGVGREALMCIYNRCRKLEADFGAAKGRLEGPGLEEQLELSKERCRMATPMDLLLTNPFLAVPFALDAAERLRQGVFCIPKRVR